MQSPVRDRARAGDVPAPIPDGVSDRIAELRRVIDNYRRARFSLPQPARAAMELRMHFAARVLADLERLLPPAPKPSTRSSNPAASTPERTTRRRSSDAAAGARGPHLPPRA